MRVADEWVGYQLDAAVNVLGTAVENALQKRVKSASGKYRQKYKLEDLLDDDFRLPMYDDDFGDDLEGLIGAHGMVYDEVR